MPIPNLYQNAEPPTEGERFETLLTRRNLVIERILSSSRTTPIEFNQGQDEWVLLVAGAATLDVKGRRCR